MPRIDSQLASSTVVGVAMSNALTANVNHSIALLWGTLRTMTARACATRTFGQRYLCIHPYICIYILLGACACMLLSHIYYWQEIVWPNFARKLSCFFFENFNLPTCIFAQINFWLRKRVRQILVACSLSWWSLFFSLCY